MVRIGLFWLIINKKDISYILVLYNNFNNKMQVE